MSDVKISAEVMGVLKKCTITENSVTLPAGQLPRPLYEAVNKVLVLAGGKWNKSAKAHLFPSDPRAKLGMALESGTVTNEKKKFQSFYTPTVLARRVAGLADVTARTVLEPSCGDGALAKACLEQGACYVRGIDINPEACASSASVIGQNGSVEEGDFLCMEPETPDAKFSRIVMNPPFTKNLDIKHVRHAMEKWLSPGGTLVAVMSPNRDRKGFTDLLASANAHYIEEVEPGTFKESGTPIATIIVKLVSKSL